MFVAGSPKHRGDHARVLYQSSFERRRLAGEFVDDAKRPIKLRIGLNSGPVLSGAICKTKFAFDVWGDTINTGARMEARGEPNKVQISDYTYQLIKDYFELNLEPAEVFMKGNGNVKTYLT